MIGMENTVFRCIVSFCFATVFFTGCSSTDLHDPEVKLTYIGSHGFLLTSAAHRILLDGAMPAGVSRWGYVLPSAETADTIVQGDEPFSQIDIITISHAHEDHYSPSVVEGAMAHNPKAFLVCTKDAYMNILKERSDFSMYEERVWIPELDYYQSDVKVLNGIAMEVSKIPHGNVPLLVFSFDLDGVRFLHLNDWIELNDEQSKQIGLGSRETDVALIGYNFVLKPQLSDMLTQKIRPRFSIICHVDGANESRFEGIQGKMNNFKNDWPMYLAKESMERMKIIKSSESIRRIPVTE